MNAYATVNINSLLAVHYELSILSMKDLIYKGFISLYGISVNISC